MINQNIYTVNYNDESEELTPPRKRNINLLSFLQVLMKPIQYMHDLFFDIYLNGFIGTIYDPALTYVKGDRVRQTDHRVYEAIQAVGAATQPPNIIYWRQIQNNWIGLRERSKYNGQKMVLEYALNKWFDTIFRYAPTLSDIYITNNILTLNVFRIAIDEQYSSFVPANENVYGIDGVPIVEVANTGSSFTIFVPIAVSNALTSEAADVVPNISGNRSNIIQGFADQYVIAGISYDIQTY